MDTLETNIHTDALTRAGTLQSWRADGRTFRATFERGTLELYSAFDGAVRVRFTQSEFAPRRSWAVTEPDDAFDASAFEVQDGDTLISGEGVRVEVSARDGSFEPAERRVVLEVYPSKQPGKVTFDGQVVEAEWRDNAVRVSYQDDGHVLELS